MKNSIENEPFISKLNPVTLFVQAALDSMARVRYSGSMKSQGLLVFLCTTLCVFWASEAAATWNAADGLILKGDVVTMTAEAAVIVGGQVLIQNEKIVAVIGAGQSWPTGVNPGNAQVVDTGGYIFPGMINLHNHTAYNTLPLWEAPKLYSNRYQWTTPKSYSTYVNYPKKLLTDSNYYNLTIETCKYGEVKGLVGGDTGIQGTPGYKGVMDMLIRNVESKNFGQDKVYQRGLSISDTRWQVTVPKFLAKAAAGGVDAWIVHLSEGVDEDPSHLEFATLKDLNMLDEWTVAIHATALDALDFAEMGDVGAKVVWSPISNMLLYGGTTRVDLAMAAGVSVSLATDWSPSGAKNLLGELKVAWELNSHFAANMAGYTPFDEYTLAQMVTTNPAAALKWTQWVGSIEVGKYADIFVFDKASLPAGLTPYQALIKTTVRDVKLVLVSGEPLYGDVNLMQPLKEADLEVICSTAGFVKAIDVTRGDIKKGEQTWATLVETLTQAMKFDAAHMRQSFKQSLAEGWTQQQFNSWFATKFSKGVVPMTPDPIYVTDDPVFFQRLQASTNASFPFNLESLYYSFLGNSGPTASIDLGLPEGELLTFVNSASAALLTGDVGVSAADAATITNYAATSGAFTSKAQILALVNACTVAVIESYLIKLNDPVAPPDPPDPPDQPVGAEAKLLAMLNHVSTTLEVLDIDAGLNKKAATALINYRNGPDGAYGTADDNYFDSEAEVDAVSYVGPSALAQLNAFAATWKLQGASGSDPEQNLLDFLNHATTTLTVLDVDVGLNKNAALNLIAHRNGLDGTLGSADDNLFDDLDEVDAVKYVGPAALLVLQTYTENWQKPDENTELLDFVNDSGATLVFLDDSVGLNSLAANKIIAHRDGPDGAPGTADDDLFDTIEELDAVPYVGASALAKLFAFAPFWASMPKGPPKAAQFLNHESVTVAYLTSQVGLKTPAASGLIGHRNGPDGELGTVDDDPFDTLNEVDAVKYVGSVTLGLLVDHAEQWVAP
ncbi:MAG TPA: hypothetical protein EYN06_04080 [Myxococcales bacterium]|nr:hypothetical protein [Myxococcales bacterium]